MAAMEGERKRGEREEGGGVVGSGREKKNKERVRCFVPRVPLLASPNTCSEALNSQGIPFPALFVAVFQHFQPRRNLNESGASPVSQGFI